MSYFLKVVFKLPECNALKRVVFRYRSAPLTIKLNLKNLIVLNYTLSRVNLKEKWFDFIAFTCFTLEIFCTLLVYPMMTLKFIYDCSRYIRKVRVNVELDFR